MRRPSRRQTVIGLGVAGVLGVLGCVPAVVLDRDTAGVRFGSAADAPQRPVALVLGAGLQPDGTPTPVLAGRIEAAAGLYRSGRVRALLMSGDHSRTDHDEVDAMSRAAVALGVPASAVVLDHAGFDTFSSCYRARYVFGVRRAVVVSQDWHLARAVWLCRQQGIDAVGVASPGSDDPTVDLAGAVREVPADLKAVLDVWTGRTPTFPGPVEHSLDAVNAVG